MPPIESGQRYCPMKITLEPLYDPETGGGAHEHAEVFVRHSKRIIVKSLFVIMRFVLRILSAHLPITNGS